MRTILERVVTVDQIAAFYPIYVRAWDQLLVQAAARHVLTFEEFAEEMSDPRIEKLIVLDEGDRFAAMTTLTNDMAAIPWINPIYYTTRYPDAADRGALFYLGYTFVDPAHRRSKALALMADQVNQRLREAGGVIGFDICSFNNEHGIGRRVGRLFSSSDRIDPLDTQTYFVADYQAEDARTAAPPDAYELTTLAKRPDLIPDVAELLAARWPRFMLAGRPGHGVDIENLVLTIPEHQVALLDAFGELSGAGLSVPLSWDGSPDTLPAGWDDAIDRSAAQLDRQEEFDTLCALSITVGSDQAGRGLAARIIAGMAAAVADFGGRHLIAPLRPARKARYPLIPMERYLGWQNEHGHAFDPWLRLHLRLGAEVLRVASPSMTITGTVHEWEGWLDLPLPESGEYVIPHGLAPLEVDLETDSAVYREPNVWIRHPVPSLPGVG